MSLRNVAFGLSGIGIGTGFASFFFGKSSPSSSQVQTPSSSQTVGFPKGPNGTINAVGSDINPSEFFRYGFPGPVADVESREEFISCYNRQTRNPHWVVEHITKESLAAKNGDRKNSYFIEDEKIPEIFRGRLRDYFRSGYDRGHQAPAANAKFSQNAMNETFYLTNMCPQVGESFNRDYWAHLEYFCRQLTESYNSVRIVTGPLYLPKVDPVDGKTKVCYEVIGTPPNIAVPTHFFKLIVGEKPVKNPSSESISIAAFVLPNKPISNETKLTDFEIPVDALERSAGLQFFQKVPENRKKPLCKEVRCQITVREFQKALPPPKSLPSLPAPK